MKLLYFIILYFLPCLFLTKSDTNNQVKVTNFGCNCSLSYCSVSNCYIKQVNRNLSTININFVLKQNISNAMVNVKLSQKPLLVTNNSYRKIFETTQNACLLINGSSNNIFLSPIIAKLKPLSNVLSEGCPYVQGKSYYYKNVPVVGTWMPSLIPTGRYKIEFVIFSLDHNETSSYIFGIADVRNSLLSVW